MRDLAAPTAKCAASETMAEMMMAVYPPRKKNGMMGMKAPMAVESAAETAEVTGLRKPSSEVLGGYGTEKLLFVPRDVIDDVVGVVFGETLDLVIERQELAGFGCIQLNGFAFASQFCLVDFTLTLGAKVGAGAHGERAGDHAGKSGEQDVVAIAESSAGDAGDNAENCAQPVIPAVDGVADPPCCLTPRALAFRQEFFE